MFVCFEQNRGHLNSVTQIPPLSLFVFRCSHELSGRSIPAHYFVPDISNGNFIPFRGGLTCNRNYHAIYQKRNDELGKFIVSHENHIFDSEIPTAHSFSITANKRCVEV